ncbi:protein kinase domain-containing protein [Acidianus manzaensis]|uniref:Serine/threonine protein kinase n=1 Tax=Acidianus manzaensis TaxID=282676 RepID=A0A1W6K0Q0_9CREN|nr:protein kinase [Acidianus manzaensis]ARM76040.1 serine/threonine protein kinase [Acidianus manzaensis]
MQFVFVTNDNKYIYDNGILKEYNGKIKVKDNIKGYLVSIENEKVKLTKIPVYDCNKIEFEGIFSEKMKFGYIFESNNSLCILEKNEVGEKLLQGFPYAIIYGKIIPKNNKHQLLKMMDDYEVIKYALKTYPNDEDIIRNSIVQLSNMNKCNEAISLYEKLDKKFPEESLAVAECYEKEGKELEALKIYSFFSDDRYKLLEEKLRKKADNLLEEYEQTGNVKLLNEAVNVLPTYDAPLIKLGWIHLKKNPNEAIKYFEEAIKRSRTYQNLLMLANAYAKAGKFMDAYKTIEEVEKIRRTAGSAYIKAYALENLNSHKDAEKEYLYACREGLVEACDKVRASMLYFPKEFYPELWLGYVIYGYEVKRVAGNGGMGYVLLVERLGKQYAMKIMKKEYNFGEMLYEVAKMQEISKNSKYMVRILASFMDENFIDYYSSPPAIVMEYMEGGDLRDILVKEEYSSLRHSSLWPEIVSIIFSKIAQGLISIHKEGYVHCDVKPSNILFTKQLPKYGEDTLNTLVNEQSIPKLSDLGSAVKIGVPVIHYTPYYAHPLQRFGQRASNEMDIYSFTVSLYVALTNNFPFPEWLERELEEAVTNPSKRDQALKDFYNTEPRMDYVPEEYRNIIYRGLRGEITMEELSRDLREIALTIYGIPQEALI